jgi:hypothetical protein
MSMEQWLIVDEQGKTEEIRENPLPATFCPLRMSREITLGGIRGSGG